MRLEVVSGDALIPNPRWLQQDPLCVCVTSVPTALLKSQRFWDVLGWERLLAQPRSEFRWFCFFIFYSQINLTEVRGKKNGFMYFSLTTTRNPQTPDPEETGTH